MEKNQSYVLPAFHSFWSLPNRVRAGGRIDFPDFELLTAILSALKWQQHSGPVSMITDEAGAEYLTSIGLGTLWDSMDTSLDRIDREVDPFYYWAAGKLYALQQMESPCVMLDTDLILWDRPEIPDDCDVMAAHYEELYPEVYPDPAGFRFREPYALPTEWDLTVRAANTAFLYIRDPAFRRYYTESAIDCLLHTRMGNLDPVTAMCFAEQRVLAMCVKAYGGKLDYLIDIAAPDAQSIVTHTWGFKGILRCDPAAREEFCMRCVRRIAEEFPDRAEELLQREDLRTYLAQYRRG